MPVNKKGVKHKKTNNTLGTGLRIGWIKFIDEYFRNGYNGTQAYLKAYPRNNVRSASVQAQRILSYDSVREEIKYRLEAERCTDSFIVSGLRDIASRAKDDKTVLVPAVKSFEVLARIRNMIKPDGNNNFFETNIAIFNPVVDIKGKKDLDEIIEAKGRLIE